MRINRMRGFAVGIYLSAIALNIDPRKLEEKLQNEIRFGRTEIHPPDPENPSIDYYPIFTAEL